MHKPLVSVIVPTKYSEATIGRCLESIKNQTYANIELIVVNSYSKDGTKKIAESCGAAVFETSAKRSEARNIGAEKSRGTLILFVDSDMELDSSVVAECVKKIREGNDAVIIPEVSVGEGFWAKCKALEKECYIGDETVEAARFFTKTVFAKMNGYDSELEAGEDWDLDHRIGMAGYRIGRIDILIKHHNGRLRLSETMLRKCYYGKMLRLYRAKHPRKAQQQLTLFRPAFINNWRRLAEDPIHALGMLLMKVCEFTLGWLGSTWIFA